MYVGLFRLDAFGRWPRLSKKQMEVLPLYTCPFSGKGDRIQERFYVKYFLHDRNGVAAGVLPYLSSKLQFSEKWSYD